MFSLTLHGRHSATVLYKQETRACFILGLVQIKFYDAYFTNKVLVVHTVD